MAPAVGLEPTTKRLTAAELDSQKSPIDIHRDRHGRRKCSNCITVIPVDKPSGLCFFCEKTQELAAQIGTRQCLRCQKVKPEDSFAGRTNKYRVCDDCRDQYPMTEEEKRRAHRMSPYYGLPNRRRRERAKAREYQRARAA